MRDKDFKYDAVEASCSDLKIVYISDEKTAVTGNTAIHMHSLWEVFLLEEGCLTVTSENESFSLTAGDLLIIPPSVYHSSASDESVSKKSVFFALEKGKEREGEERLFSKVRAAFSGGFRLIKGDEYAASLLFRLLEGYPEGIIGREHRMRACVAELILHLYDVIKDEKHQLLEEALSQSSYCVYKYAIDRLLDIYYMTDISLEVLAQKLYASPKTVARIISVAYGKSFNELKLELKMRNAKKLLRETDLSVRVIAERIGYTTTRGFLSAFSKYQGMTPSEYRRSSGKEA